METYTLREEPISKKLNTVWIDIFVAVVLIVMVAVLWLPFRFGIAPTMDDWSVSSWAFDGRFVDFGIARPFSVLPTALGLVLIPNAYISLSLVLLLSMALKGYMIYLLFRQFSFNPGMSLAVASVFTFYPADLLIITTRTVGIHTAIMLFFLSLVLLVESLNRERFYLWLVASVVSFVIAIFIYEVIFPLAFLAPILLWLRYRKRDKRFYQVAATWYVIWFAVFVRFLFFSFSQDASYQQSKLDLDTFNLGDWLHVLLNVSNEVILQGWLNVNSSVQATNLLIILFNSICVAVLVWLFYENRAKRPFSHHLVLLMIGAIILVGGFALYLPTTLRNS